MNIIAKHNPVLTANYTELEVNVFDIRLPWYTVTNIELHHSDISAK